MNDDPKWTDEEIDLTLDGLRLSAVRAAETDDVVEVHGGLLVGILDRLADAEAWVPRAEPDPRTVTGLTIHVDPPPPTVIVLPVPPWHGQRV